MPSDPFIDFSSEVEYGLYKAINLLTERKITAPIDEVRVIVPEIAELEANLARVRANRLAYLAKTDTFTAPDRDAIDASAQLVAGLDAMTAESVVAGTILSSASNLMQLYNATV